MPIAKTKKNAKRTSPNRLQLLKRYKWSGLIAVMLVASVAGIYFAFAPHASKNANAGQFCGTKYCYYPLEPAIAYWQNGLRTTFNVPYPYMPLNVCMSWYASKWSAYMHDNNYVQHSRTRWNWTGEMSRCGRWSWLGENIWVGYCNDARGNYIGDNNCSWKIVDGPSGSFLNDGENPNTHLANILHPEGLAQGVGVFGRSPGPIYVTAEYAHFQ